MSVRTLPGGALVVWPETLSRTPWLINKSAGGPPFTQGVGTHGYMDPEYIDMGTFSPKSDIFSMGVVFLELLTGQAATNSTLRPVCLYARMRSRLPADARSVAASEARWANPLSRVVEEFAQIAVRCVAAAGEDRATLLEVLRYK